MTVRRVTLNDSPSAVPHDGHWRTKHFNRWTDYIWVAGRGRAFSLPPLPDEKGVLHLDFTGEKE